MTGIDTYLQSSRNIVADRYQLLIDALHDESETHCSIETEMTFEDGRKGTVEADLRIMNLQKINTPVRAIGRNESKEA